MYCLTSFSPWKGYLMTTSLKNKKLKGKSHGRNLLPTRVVKTRLSKAGITSSAAKLREKIGLKQPDFARLLGVSVRSLAKLESGQPPASSMTRRLNETQRLISALMESIKEKSLGKWLVTPNQAFDNLKPLEVIERGEPDRIWAMVYFLRSGVPV